jgi:hypothetical protein
MPGLVSLGASLLQKGISFAKQTITQARIGRQVLASGATITTSTSGSGTNTVVGPGGQLAIPIWLWYLGGGILLLLIIWKVISSVFTKRR